MLKYFYNLFIILSTVNYIFSFSLSGFIYSDKGEKLSNATIIVNNSNEKIVQISDLDGFYIFNDLEMGEISIKVSYVGFVSEEKNLSVSSNLLQDFKLTESLINFNQIVVTGTKNEHFIKDSPVLTHVVNNKIIKNSSYTTVKGIMEYAFPNVQSVYGNHGSVNRVKIQGLDSKFTTFLIDGNKITGEFAGNIDFSMMNLINIDRIEFVNGAMSTLYGSSAIGGVVNIITRKKQAPYWGSFSILHDYPLVKSTSYNFGFNYKKLYYDLSIIQKSSPGYNIILNDPTIDSNTLEPYEDLTFINNIKYDINNSIYFDIKFKLYNSHIKKTTFWNGIDEVKDSPQSIYVDSTYAIKLTKKFNNGSSLQIVNNKEVYCKKYSYPYYFSGSWLIEDMKPTEKINAIHLRNEIGVMYTLPMNNNYYVFGVEKIEQSYASYNIYNSNNSLINESIFDGEDSTINRFENAYYIYHENKINSDNELSIGLRSVNHQNYKGKLLPSFSYLYKLEGLYNLRFTYGSGYRLPSIKELYYKWEAHSPAIYGSPNLLASESDYYSISIDKKENNEFSVSLYLNKIKNMISTQYLDGNLYFGNYNKVDIMGLNMHYSRYINKNNLIKFVYNYSNPESNSNEILEGISKHALRIQYTYNISSNQTFNINIKYCGDKYNFNQESELYSKLDAYWMTDTIWSLNYEYIKLNVGIKNIFNYLDNNRIDSEILNTYDPGRRIFLGLTFNF